MFRKLNILLFLAVCGFASNVAAQPVLRLIPPSGATFAPGQRFDLRLEADALQSPPRDFSIEINGRDEKKDLFGSTAFQTFAPPAAGRGATAPTGLNGGITRRNWSFAKPGKYE